MPTHLVPGGADGVNVLDVHKEDVGDKVDPGNTLGALAHKPVSGGGNLAARVHHRPLQKGGHRKGATGVRVSCNDNSNHNQQSHATRVRRPGRNGRKTEKKPIKYKQT